MQAEEDSAKRLEERKGQRKRQGKVARSWYEKKKKGYKNRKTEKRRAKILKDFTSSFLFSFPAVCFPLYYPSHSSPSLSVCLSLSLSYRCRWRAGLFSTFEHREKPSCSQKIPRRSVSFKGEKRSGERRERDAISFLEKTLNSGNRFRVKMYLLERACSYTEIFFRQ